MALAVIIIITFVIPAIVIGLIVSVYRHFKREIAQERAENKKLIKAFERLDATKESVITKLKRFVPKDL
jgi:hypothetical protein